MLAIIVSACLTSDPSVCRDYKIHMQEEMDPLTCAMYAAPYFVPWAEEHPGWQIKKWRCASATEDDI